MPLPPFDAAAFVRFLIAEGLVDDRTLVTGTDPEVFVAEQVRAGRLSEADLAGARTRFLAGPTRATQQTPDATLRSPGMTDLPLDPRDPLLGKVLGGCRLDKLLGEGGMGAVYLATQLSLDRKVAVKIQKEIAIAELVERFRSEAKTLGRLHSPHIVDVYEVGSEQGLPWFVMEFMPGGSLAGHVRKLPNGRLPPQDAQRLLLESALGLAEAERHGVLHRDIKPDNLLLDDRGTLKIADFGIAKVLSDDPGLTQTGFSPGTPAFKSPEQVAGRTLDFRTDMYSLGVSFWALVTGERPRDVVTRQEAMEQTDRRALPCSSPELAQAGGDPLLEAICRMMALKREDRFASWQALIDELRALPAAGAPRRAAPTVVVKQASAAAPRSKRTPIGIGIAAAATAGLAFAFWPKGDAPKSAQESQQASNGSQPQPQPPQQPQEQPQGPEQSTPKTAPPSPSKDTATSPPNDLPTKPNPTPDPNQAAREQLLAELAQPLPTSPRSAADVQTAATALATRAQQLGLADDPRWRDLRGRLEEEQLAATTRDALRAITTLSNLDGYEQLPALRTRAAAIPLANYRADVDAHLDQLERDRPRKLRVAAADRTWLTGWGQWRVGDDNVVERDGRWLPIAVRDTRRGAGCTMVLLWPPQQPPLYLDATEVTLGQWRAKFAVPADLDGPTGDEFPVRHVRQEAIDAFLAEYDLRLPTVAEFAFALAARPDDTMWWGNGEAPPATYPKVNVADAARRQASKLAPYLKGYDDGLAEVGAAFDPRFAQGRDGAFCHLLGNVAEWLHDGQDRKALGGSYLASSWAVFAQSYRQPVLGEAPRDVGFRAARSVPQPR